MGFVDGKSFESNFPYRRGPADGLNPPELSIPSIRRGLPATERQEALEEFIKSVMSLDSLDLVLDGVTTRRLSHFFSLLYLDADGNAVFRHQYAGISKILYSEMEAAEPDGLLVEKPSALSNLEIGLDQVMEAVRSLRALTRRRKWQQANGMPSSEDPDKIEGELKRLDSILKSLGKLYDHIALETTRIEYIVKQNRASEEARLSLDRAIAERKEELDGFDRKLTETQEKVSRDNIGVLGVFAAIVLAFNGGISFSTSSLEAIGAGSGVIPVLLTVDIVGFVLLNAIGLLLHFVWKMSLGKDAELKGWPKFAWIASDLILFAFAVYLISRNFMPVVAK